MKTTRSAAGLCLAGFSFAAFSLSALAAPEPVTSTLSAATVYLDRAVVTRTAALDNLAVGEHELTFDNLPSTLMDDSLQVTASLSSAQATILDVNARNTFVDATPNPLEKKYEDEIKDLSVKQRVLDDQAFVIGQQRDYLLKIQAASTTPVSGVKDANLTNVDDWSKLLTFTADGLSAVSLQQQKLDQTRSDLHDQQTALEQQLAQLRNANPNPGAGLPLRINPYRSRNVKTVTVRLKVATAGSLKLALAYGVRNASWSPSYDARLKADPTAPVVALDYYGNIRQNTGEDWSQVQLTLSTARPSLGGGAPELNAWVLDMRQPPRPVVTAHSTGSGFGVSGGAVRGAAVAPTAAASGFNSQQFNRDRVEDLTINGGTLDLGFSTATATVATGVTSASYLIPVPTTILSDNTVQKAGIASIKLPAKLQYESTPQMMEAAFLSAYATNTSDFPLLAGPMNTFLGNDFIAASSLKTVMPTEKFELNLGADEGITVKRRLVNRLTDTTGFSKQNLITYEFSITATNNKKTRVHYVFKELLPITRNDQIKVSLLTPSEREVGTTDKPGKEVTLEEDGKLVWRVDLAPGEKRVFPLKFTVVYPKDFAIEGLE